MWKSLRNDPKLCIKDKKNSNGLASVAGAVIEATARPDLEDFLRTRSPGEVING